MSHDKGKIIHSKERKIIYNVLCFFEKEALEGQLTIPIKQAQNRATAATGVSRSTVARIKKEGRASNDLSTPGRRKKPQKNRDTVANVSDLDLSVVRRIICEYYACKKVPSLRCLLPAVRAKIGFRFKKETLRKLLHKIGFNYRHCKNRGRVAIEKPDIVHERYRYLREMQTYRRDGRNIIFLNETWIDGSMKFRKCWRIENIADFMKRNSGDVLLVIHACNQDGLIPGVNLIIQPDYIPGDYSELISYDIISEWLTDKLMPHIPPNSVICMDSAPHHFKTLNPKPSKYATKEELLAWLRDNEIPHSLQMRKTELYDLAVANAPPEKKYWVGEVLKDNGYDILRIPFYHADLNAIDLAWAEVKEYIRQRSTNSDLNLEVMKLFITETYPLITREQWKKYYDQVLETENNYWQLDNLVEETVEQFIFVMETDTSEDSDASESAESDFDMYDSETSLSEIADTKVKIKVEKMITPD